MIGVALVIGIVIARLVMQMMGLLSVHKVLIRRQAHGVDIVFAIQ
jgi:hypothetical protein